MTTEETPHPLGAEDFEPLIGRTASFGDFAFALTLDRVERAGRSSDGGNFRVPFILIFSSPRGDSYLMDGLYRCDFGDGIAFDLFLNPIHTPDPRRQDYQVLFN